MLSSQHRCSRAIASLPLLGRTRDAGTAIFVSRQPAGQGKCWPGAQPIAHVRVREPPQCSQEGNRQQGFFAVRAWDPSWATWYRGWAATMCQPHSQTAEREQMEGLDESEGIKMYVWATSGLRTV